MQATNCHWWNHQDSSLLFEPKIDKMIHFSLAKHITRNEHTEQWYQPTVQEAKQSTPTRLLNLQVVTPTKVASARF
jgi:hypothetical protein